VAQGETVRVVAPSPVYNERTNKWECPDPWQVTGSGTGRRCQETGRD
jgi:hypothetical protein